jgi:hypothetical protein
MRRLLLTLILVAGPVVLGWDGVTVTACGDKFLLIRGSARFQRAHTAMHPASILLYRPGKAAKGLAIQDPHLAAGLKQAGHKVDILDDGSKLSATLNTRRYDIVLADFADAMAFESQVRQAVSKPALVPVMYQRSQAETAAAEKQFVCLLKAPERISYFLNVLDDLMKTRLTAAQGNTPKTE